MASPHYGIDANALATAIFAALIYGEEVVLEFFRIFRSFCTPSTRQISNSYNTPAVNMNLKLGKKAESKRYPIMLGLATGNPKYKVTQKDALSIALKAKGCDGIRHVLDGVYTNSKISTRFMAIPDFTPDQKDEDDDNFFPDDNTYSLPVQLR
jgi:hypothetical protein